MLSEEEKKAIEGLKKDLLIHECWEANNLDKIFKISHLHSLRVVLNLIEKQQKEIEELKNADLTSVYLDGVYDGEKEVNDKIKAKIEELDKEEKQMLKGTKGQDRYAIKQEYMYKRSGLQSLLEKGDKK